MARPLDSPVSDLAFTSAHRTGALADRDVGVLVVRINPFRTFRALWNLLAGLTGTHIEVKAPDAMVLIRIF
jgi:hypothetical protein